MTDNISAMCFKSIVNFVSDLNEEFGDIAEPLRLLFKNLEQITFTQKSKIDSNITPFKEFCMDNSAGILNRNYDEFKTTRITQSEKAFIDFDYIFRVASEEHKSYIWAHLLTILAIVDPASQAKTNLQTLQFQSASVGAPGGDILGDIIKKIEREVAGSSSENPIELVSKIMQSGTFSEILADLTASIEKGDIDVTKLASSIGLAIPK